MLRNRNCLWSTTLKITWHYSSCCIDFNLCLYVEFFVGKESLDLCLKGSTLLAEWRIYSIQNERKPYLHHILWKCTFCFLLQFVVVRDVYYAFTNIVWCFSLCHNTFVDEPFHGDVVLAVSGRKLKIILKKCDTSMVQAPDIIVSVLYFSKNSDFSYWSWLLLFTFTETPIYKTILSHSMCFKPFLIFPKCQKSEIT